MPQCSCHSPPSLPHSSPDSRLQTAEVHATHTSLDSLSLMNMQLYIQRPSFIADGLNAIPRMTCRPVYTQLVVEGVTEVDKLPVHTAISIASASKQTPNTCIQLRPPLGQSPELVQLIYCTVPAASEQFCPPHAAVVVTVKVCFCMPAPPATTQQACIHSIAHKVVVQHLMQCCHAAQPQTITACSAQLKLRPTCCASLYPSHT